MNVIGNFLTALDQALNCLIRINGEYGMPDETLSARAWRVRMQRPAYQRWIDRLFFWERGHCEAAYINEQKRWHLPESYQE